MTPIVLTIAATDSSNGAGATLDLRIFHKLGVYGSLAVTAVTAQNSKGVHKIFKVAPRIIEAQIDAVVKDFPVKSCKIGMLYSPEIVNCVARRIKRRNIPNVILDIPLVSKNGTEITKASACKAIVKNLLPLALLITPNRQEAEKLAKMEINTYSDRETACRKITDLGVKNVLLKGGHFDMPCDIFFDGENFMEFSGEKYTEKCVHGTGCALSSAVCAFLAKGLSLPESIEQSKTFMNNIIPLTERFGKGEMDFIL